MLSNIWPRTDRIIAGIMGSSFLFYEDILYEAVKVCRMPPSFDPNSFGASPRPHSGNCEREPEPSPEDRPPQIGSNTDVWNDEPTTKGIILYSIVTTIICCLGIFGNSLSLMVLKRKELTGSIYTYLAVLAATDLSLSIIYFLSGLSRGAFYGTSWATYDALIGMPITAAISSLGVMATVAVTIDRVLFLWHPVQCTRPRFCNPRLARKLMTVGLFLALLMNTPYCFIFNWDERGYLITSPFFHSTIYTCFNWFMLLVLTIIPALVLILGNGFLITVLQKSHKLPTKCNGKRRDHTNLTIILIAIIILFLISEIPSNMVSRTKANSLLFGDDPNRINSRALEVTRQICTLLGALNVTMNFLLYYLFCPTFCRALVKTIKREKEGKKRQLGANINVFVVESYEDGWCERNQKIVEVSIRPSILSTRKSIDTQGGEQTLDKKIGSSFEDTEYVEIIDSLEVRKVGPYSSLENEPTAVASD